MFASAFERKVVGIRDFDIIHRQVIFLTVAQINFLLFEIFALPLLTLKDFCNIAGVLAPVGRKNTELSVLYQRDK